MPSLDHIIILVPPSFLKTPPSFITENFTVSPGGRHAGNVTENKLIVFKDGVYIELISFVEGTRGRESHWWGRKAVNVIVDFAFTSPPGESAQENYEQVNGRLAKSGTGAKYNEPKAGGRVKPDGVKVEWHVTFPDLGNEGEEKYQRGTLPFFCHDDTQREVRVPREEKNLFHPSGAIGVKSLTVFVSPENVEVLRKIYTAILDVKDDGEGGFETSSLYGGHKTKIVIKLPGEGEEELKKEVEARGGYVLGDLVLRRQAGDGVGKRIDGEGLGLGGIYLE